MTPGRSAPTIEMYYRKGVGSMVPLVSVVIPTRHRPNMLRRAVDSVLSQTHTHLELIVVVDGPDPTTIDVLKYIHDPRLHILPLMINVGVAEARNIGARDSVGEWIAFLDDDDEWLSEKLARQLSIVVNADPGLNFVACRHREGDTATNRILPRRFPRRDEDWSEYICCDNNLCLPSSWLIRRDLLRALPFDRDVSLCEDILWLLGARASHMISPAWLDEALVVFHNDHKEPEVVDDGPDEEPTRLSRTRHWQTVYEWASANQTSILTKRAFSYCLIRFCLPRAKRSDTPFRDCFFVLSSAIFAGNIDLRLCLLIGAHVCLTETFRRQLRYCYEALARELHTAAWMPRYFPRPRIDKHSDLPVEHS